MKHMTASLVVAVFFAMLLVGCKKEQENNNTAETVTTEKNVSKGMLRFSSAEEFAEVRQKVLAMGEDERREWERKQGFKSFATKCNELFEELEAKGITSDEDIYNFVKENPDYFYIYVDENGEEYLSSYLEDSYYFELANEDKMLQIGKETVKAFDEGIMIASKYESLLSVKEYDSSVVCEGIRVCPIATQGSIKVFRDDDDDQNGIDGCNCGEMKKIIARKTNGRDRTYVRVSVKNSGEVVPGLCYMSYEMRVRPYYKTLGIWYWCKREISYNMDVSFFVPGGDQRRYSAKRLNPTVKTWCEDYHFETVLTLEEVAMYLYVYGYGSTPNAYRPVSCQFH